MAAQPDGSPTRWLSVGQVVALTASDYLPEVMVRFLRGGAQIRAHLWVFPLFLVSALGEKEV